MSKETLEPQYYDTVYFTDSDDDAKGIDGGPSVSPSRWVLKQDQRRIPTNDDLLYDPEADDKDAEWITRKSAAYLGPEFDHPSRATLPTDALLHCPMCQTTLCFVCQRHDRYTSQYRALFVENCQVLWNEMVCYSSKGPIPQSQAANTDVIQPGESEPSQPRPGYATHNKLTDADLYHPVQCLICDTHVAYFDRDEVYHFFNTIAT
ncbi:hypothetical protein IWQ61_003859 [Dispira simplex]|nr:hypothetical protein IWQ61_003859 [Dispira simplex]